MRDVAVIGCGMIPFGELWNQSLRQMWGGAALAALDDAGVETVDLITIGCMSSGLFVGQEHLASLLPAEIGLAGVPAGRVESACASGGLAFRSGFAEVASGLADTVLVTGVEKMTDVDSADATYALGTAADRQWEGFHGITFPGLYAMLAQAHMREFGTTRDQLAQVAVKNHANGLLNPNAQFHLDIGIDDVKASTLVADPLGLLDCSPVTDGAAAVVLTTVERARELQPDRPVVRVTGSGMATDAIALASRRSLTELAAVKQAAERAYQMSGRGPQDLDVVEVHDCFTIAEIMVVEALGLAPLGRGGFEVEAGAFNRDGRCPVNCSGGLKAKGHPVGATGVAQIVEIAEQLRGQSGDRQVADARIGMAQNMGGSGGSSVVHILEVE
jgi:acetyl-CoA C-acetyltransferase